MRCFFGSLKLIKNSDLGSTFFWSRSTWSWSMENFCLFSVVGELASIFSAFSVMTLIFFQRFYQALLYFFRVFSDGTEYCTPFLLTMLKLFPHILLLRWFFSAFLPNTLIFHIFFRACLVLSPKCRIFCCFCQIR